MHVLGSPSSPFKVAVLTALVVATLSSSANAQVTNDNAAHPPAGDFGLELVAGLGAVGAATALSVGAAYVTFDNNFGGGRHGWEAAIALGVGFGTYLVAAPLLASWTVSLAGDGTGGNGRYLSALAWSAAGTLAGFGLAAAMLAPETDGAMRAILPLAACSALIAGPVFGAIIGYRISADFPVQAIALPTADGRGGMLTFSGTM